MCKPTMTRIILQTLVRRRLRPKSCLPLVLLFLIVSGFFVPHTEAAKASKCHKRLHLKAKVHPTHVNPGHNFTISVHIPKTVCQGKNVLSCTLQIAVPDGAVIDLTRVKGYEKVGELPDYSKVFALTVPDAFPIVKSKTSKKHWYDLQFAADICAPIARLPFKVTLIQTMAKPRQKSVCNATVATTVRTYILVFRSLYLFVLLLDERMGLHTR